MKKPKFIRTIQTIAFALIMGVTTFVCMVLGVFDIELYFDPNFEDVMILIATMFSFSSIFVSQFLYAQKTKDVENLILSQKKARFQTATIIQLALLEAPALFSIAQLMISGNLIFLIFAVLLLVLMLISFPTLFKFESDFMLTKEEKTELAE